MLDRTLDDGSVDELAVVTELAVDGTPRIFTHTGNLYVYECSIHFEFVDAQCVESLRIHSSHVQAANKKSIS
jgi:hypothetical protein